MSDLMEVIERRLYEMLDAEDKAPTCDICGRKAITPAQMGSAIQAALKYLAMKNPQPAVEAGSGFKEDEE